MPEKLTHEQRTGRRRLCDNAADGDCIPAYDSRGIGMDVVRNAVEELGGSLSLHTFLGQGSQWTSRNWNVHWEPRIAREGLPLKQSINSSWMMSSRSNPYVAGNS